MVAADLAVERADQQPVGPQQPDQQPSDRVVPHARHLRPHPSEATGQVGREFPARRRRRRGQRPDHEHSRARERRDVLPGEVSESALHAVADHGVAHRLADHEADPRTGRPATGPPRQRGARPAVRLPDRRPARTACRKEAPSVRRWSGDSTCRPGAAGPAVRPRGSCGPCGGARTGSSDPRGCASAGGSRAPCDGGGCSAGTYACSRASLHAGSGQPRRAGTAVLVSSASERLSAGTAHPRA